MPYSVGCGRWWDRVARGRLGLSVYAICLVWGQGACQPDDRLQEGRRLLAEERYEEALQLLEAAGADADRYLARAYVALGRFDAAVQAAERALDRDGGDAELHEIRGTVLTARAFALDEFRHTAAAEAAFLRALELDPDRAHSHYNLGVIYTHRGRLEDARNAYLAALHVDSTLVAAHKKVAELFRKSGDTQEAMNHFRRATELADDDAQAFYYLGVVLRDGSRHEEALVAFTRAADLNPHSPQILWGLGQAYVRMGNREEGRRVLTRSEALRQQKRDLGSDVTPPQVGAVPVGPAKAHHALGLHRAVRGDLEGAAREYSTAIAIDSTYVDGYSGLGVVLTMQGDYDGAVTALQTAVSLTPNDAVTRTRLGLALLKAGDFDRSRAALQRAAAGHRAFPELSYTRGLLEARAGNLDEARKHFGQAVQLRPQYRDALLNLGVMSMKTGHTQEAADAYARLVEVDPDNARAHLYLSDAYRQLGLIVESQAHRRTAERLRTAPPAMRGSSTSTLPTEGDSYTPPRVAAPK